MSHWLGHFYLYASRTCSVVSRCFRRSCGGMKCARGSPSAGTSAACAPGDPPVDTLCRLSSSLHFCWCPFSDISFSIGSTKKPDSCLLYLSLVGLFICFPIRRPSLVFFATQIWPLFRRKEFSYTLRSRCISVFYSSQIDELRCDGIKAASISRAALGASLTHIRTLPRHDARTTCIHAAGRHSYSKMFRNAVAASGLHTWDQAFLPCCPSFCVAPSTYAATTTQKPRSAIRGFRRRYVLGCAECERWLADDADEDRGWPALLLASFKGCTPHDFCFVAQAAFLAVCQQLMTL